MKKFIYLLLCLIVPQFAFAATLIISPKTISVDLNQTITLSVLVNSSDQAINAVSANVNFPADFLRVTKIETANSVIKFWATEPSYSNSDGTINLEGVIFNPGYIGSGGKVATIYFKPIKTGNPQISFASGSVLANDGQGTEVLTGTGSAQIIVEKSNVPSLPAEPEIIVPIPVIISPTHPIQGQEYSEKTASFNWDLPAGVEAVRISYGLTPSPNPAVLYEPAINTKNIIVDDNGTYYFNAQFRKGGIWGEAAHYKFSIVSASGAQSDPINTAPVATSTVPAPPEELSAGEISNTPAEYVFPGETELAFNIIALLLVVIFFLILRIRKAGKSKGENQENNSSESPNSKKIIQHAFNVLNWDVKRQLNLLNGVKKERDLTNIEKIIDKNLQESLKLTEEYLEQELRLKKKKIIHRKSGKK